jgi:hypothetical protein
MFSRSVCRSISRQGHRLEFSNLPRRKYYVSQPQKGISGSSLNTKTGLASRKKALEESGMERRGKNDFGDNRGNRGGAYDNKRGKGYNSSSHSSGVPDGFAAALRRFQLFSPTFHSPPATFLSLPFYFNSVCSKFNCQSKNVSHFSDQDPFNPNNTLEGWICKADGPFFGSLYIHKLNGDILDEPQVIYGVPKIVRSFRGLMNRSIECY